MGHETVDGDIAFKFASPCVVNLSCKAIDGGNVFASARVIDMGCEVADMGCKVVGDGGEVVDEGRKAVVEDDVFAGTRVNDVGREAVDGGCDAIDEGLGAINEGCKVVGKGCEVLDKGGKAIVKDKVPVGAVTSCNTPESPASSTANPISPEAFSSIPTAVALSFKTPDSGVLLMRVEVELYERRATRVQFVGTETSSNQSWLTCGRRDSREMSEG